MYSNNVPRPVRQLLLLVTFAAVCLIQLPATPSRIRAASPALSQTPTVQSCPVRRSS